MIPGPDRVIACPRCEALHRVRTLISGNTLGARRWTDGKIVAPMLPRPPAITRCQACAHFFWLSEARRVGEFPLSAGEPVPEAWRAAPYVRELAEKEFLEALEAGVAKDREGELNLRTFAWWAANDLVRDWRDDYDPEPRPLAERSPWAAENLERLVAMLDEGDPVERVMKAEALRELGRFEEALRLLTSDFPENYAAFVAYLRDLAARRDALVRALAT